jgi:ribosomal protein S18 acetylase RimI-like enzyme
MHDMKKTILSKINQFFYLRPAKLRSSSLVTLKPMTQAEFEDFLKISVPHYVSELMEARNHRFEDARVLAEKSFRSLFPDNRVDSPDQFVYSIMDEEVAVGYLHLGIRREMQQPYLYVWDILINPTHRGRGYGKQAMLLAEKKGAEWGLMSLRLNVFRHNKAAMNLYQKIGFKTESMMMSKPI